MGYTPRGRRFAPPLAKLSGEDRPVDFFRLAKPQIGELAPYVPGRLYEGPGTALKLASNENLLGISPKVREAIIAELDYLHYYPDDEAHKVRVALADWYGCLPENVIAANGGVEIIRYVIETFLSPGDEMIMPWPGFHMFDIYACKEGASRIRVPVRDDFTPNLEKMLDEITPKTKMICLDNPNNPCGTYAGERELTLFINSVPDNVIIFLDEAYYDFATAADFRDNTRIWQEHPNVVVLRTFAKAYALAGLRAGCALGAKELIEVVWRVKGTFSMSRLAQVALLAALNDAEHYRASMAQITEMRDYVGRLLDEAGLFHPPSQTNFYLFDSGVNGMELNELMCAEQVYLRHMKGFGLPSYFRASMPPDKAGADRFIDALMRSIAKVKALGGEMEAAVE